MKKRQIIFIIFGICFLSALALVALFQKNSFSSVGMLVQFVMAPLQKVTIKTANVLHVATASELQDENKTLKTQITKLQLVAQDNVALRDQFKITNPASRTLLPADIVGMPSFFPGVSAPEQLVINKGKKDGVDIGSVVVFKDNIIGSVTNSNNHFALITVIGNKTTSTTAKTAKTGALGVIKGEGNGQMLFDNVVLSDSLQVGDMVVTEGDTSFDGKGSPPGLIIGKIISVEKTPSALFQKANVQSLVDVSRIPMVFVITKEK